MAEFAVVIRYQFEGESASALVLDTINENVINSNTTITEQPLVNGDEISDHQFQLPKTMTLSGSCSLQGSKGIVVDGGGSKLANFEELVERIQKEGVLCDIYKVAVNNDKDVRFTQRTNMVLESISLVEKINSLDFTLSFRQVLIADVLEYDVDTSDPHLPSTEVSTTSFTNTLMDWSQIDASIINILRETGLMTESFWNACCSLGWEKWAALGGATIAGIVIAAIAVTATVPLVGWAIAGVALAVGAVYTLVKSIYNKIKKAKETKKYAIERFEWSKNENKNDQELERFSDFLYSIHQEINKIDSLLHVYQISSNEDQEAMVNIGNDYYIFTFTRNNINGRYTLDIKNIDDTSLAEMPDITACAENFSGINSYNYILKARNNARIYLINPNEDKLDLTKYFILVCDFNPDDFNKIIDDIINSFIYKNAG